MGASTKQALMVIYRSPNGRSNWQPIPPNEVPDWLKRPSYMGRLAAGEMCMKADEGRHGSDWYRAQVATRRL